jgi:hypothetical protein
MHFASTRQSSHHARRHRRGIGWVAAVAAALILSLHDSARAQCEGDCDGNDTVAINELILAVRIALGSAAAHDCTAVDRNNNHTVSIDELVFAVTRALQGCSGTVDEEVVRASIRASVDPIVQIVDLGGAAVGAGARTARLADAVARPAGLSGCQQFDCVAFGEVTGSEEICCLGTEYRLTSTTCTVEDINGVIATRTGSFTLRTDPQDCTGTIPVGVDFAAVYDDFTFELTDTDGSYYILFADQSETFATLPTGCSAPPDDFGLGLRGDGIRVIQGDQREVVGDGSGNVLFDEELSTDVELVVVSADAGETCAVGAQIDGTITSRDFVAAAEFTTEYTEFVVAQASGPDAVFLGLDGTFSTDCVGEVTVQTSEPLRLGVDDTCLTGGSLEVVVGGATATVEYTRGGGLEIDYGSDGSTDQTYASCQDVELEECVPAEG